MENQIPNNAAPSVLEGTLSSAPVPNAPDTPSAKNSKPLPQADFVSSTSIIASQENGGNSDFEADRMMRNKSKYWLLGLIVLLLVVSAVIFYQYST